LGHNWAKKYRGRQTAHEFVKENGKITNSIYRGMYNLSEKTAFRDFEKLIEIGILIKVGERKGTYYILKVG
jgi:ATP-dependent DNA helicase RecG